MRYHDFIDFNTAHVQTVFWYLPIFIAVLRYWVPPNVHPRYDRLEYKNHTRNSHQLRNIRFPNFRSSVWQPPSCLKHFLATLALSPASQPPACTVTYMYQSVPRASVSQLPQAHSQAFDFFENLWSNSPLLLVATS